MDGLTGPRRESIQSPIRSIRKVKEEGLHNYGLCLSTTAHVSMSDGMVVGACKNKTVNFDVEVKKNGSMENTGDNRN